MRRAISFLLIAVFLTSSGSTVFAQRTRDRQRQAAPPARTEKGRGQKPGPQTVEAKFGVAQAFTDGDGVWVHWRMDTEVNNQGFQVYRLDQDGERLVSDFVLGSASKYGDAPTYGENYAFFDKNGTAGSVYRVETAGTKRVTQSDSFSVKSVSTLPKIDGENLFQQAVVSEEQVRPTVVELSLPDDLRWEVAYNAITPNPDKHREVISQPGVRISAKASGLIRVTRAELQAGGFDVNADPTTWQLYLQGVELPIIIGPNADYLEFLGKALDTVESDIRVYYLIAGPGPGKRMKAASPRRSLGTIIAKKYDQTTVKKEKTSFDNTILNGPVENFWGRVVSTSTVPFTFNLTGIDQTPGDRELTLKFQGLSQTPHNISITLNGNPLAPIVGMSRDPMVKSYAIPVGFLVEGQNTLQMSSPLGDTSFFDNLSIDFPRSYLADNDRIDFYTQTNKITRLSGFSTANVRLFDVTYDEAPVEIVHTNIIESNGKFGPEIPAGRSRLFYATEASKFGSVISIKPYDPTLLEVPTESAQLLIISHAALMSGAQSWADYRAGQGISTKLIDVAEIFDEFSYGVSTSVAIEDFIQFAKNNWQVRPDYVLLIGDASFDPKNYLGLGAFNDLPTRMVNTLYEETGSDEALADFNDDGLAELAIGRASVRNNGELATVLNKTMLWEQNLTATSLKDRGVLFAYDQNEGWDFLAMSNRLMDKLPIDVPRTTVQRGVPTDADSKLAVKSAFNSGVFIANYSGHGTAGAWRNTAFFANADIMTLTNTGAPALVTALTCLNAYFVVPHTTSLAETITKSTNGGAVAIWASTGKTTPDVQEVMAARFYEQLAAGNITRMGDLVKDAKAQLISGADVRLSWTLIGDPMLKVR